MSTSRICERIVEELALLRHGAQEMVRVIFPETLVLVALANAGLVVPTEKAMEALRVLLETVKQLKKEANGGGMP